MKIANRPIRIIFGVMCYQDCFVTAPYSITERQLARRMSRWRTQIQ